MDRATQIHNISMQPHTSKREVYNIWSSSYDNILEQNILDLGNK